MENKELNESLKRYKELLGYDLEKGKRSLTERNHKPYLMEADPEGGNTDDNADFDFGDEGDSNDKEGDKGGFDFGDAGGEDTGGDDNAGFDFGDDQGADTGDNGDFDFGGEGDTEEEVDEFGTADEFSAADDLETEDGDTEEIDVTDIVKRADDAKGSAEKAVVAAEEGKNMIKDLMAKFQNLEASLSKIDNVSSEISSIKQDLQMQKPKEKLELRSLDSYPFNVKLTDYWNDVAAKGNYEITDGNEPDGVSADGQVKVWDITPEDTKTYNATDIQKSFIPESKSKKKVLTEGEKWDKFRDLMYDYYLMTKNLVKLGYEIPPFVIKAYRLRKNPEKLKEFAELWKKDMTIYMEDLVKTHPEYYFKSKLNGLLQRLKELDDITYSEFEKNPKKFSSHQQDILLGGMKVTDSGIERDLDRYKLK
jgi:hypothetical protein